MLRKIRLLTNLTNLFPPLFLALPAEAYCVPTFPPPFVCLRVLFLVSDQTKVFILVEVRYTVTRGLCISTLHFFSSLKGSFLRILCVMSFDSSYNVFFIRKECNKIILEIGSILFPYQGQCRSLA